MYKKSDHVNKFTTDVLKNWKVELTSRKKTLSDDKTSFRNMHFWYLCNGYNAAQLHRKSNGGHKFTKSQEKINHFIYMDDINLFVKKMKKN